MKRQLRCHEAFALGEHEAKRPPFPLRAAKPRFIGQSPTSLFMHRRCASFLRRAGYANPHQSALHFDCVRIVGSPKKGYGECRILFLVTLQCEHNQSATHFDVGSHTPPGGSYPHPILEVYSPKGEILTRRRCFAKDVKKKTSLKSNVMPQGCPFSGHSSFSPEKSPKKLKPHPRSEAFLKSKPPLPRKRAPPAPPVEGGAGGLAADRACARV